MQFGLTVRRLRKQAGMTQAELAEHLEISQQYLADIEAGSKPLRTLVLAAAIANVLNVSIDDLMRGEPESEPDAATQSVG